MKIFKEDMHCHLEPEMIRKLQNDFKTEESYIDIMANLWKTRSGLLHIIMNRPDLESVIKPQFKALNNMIGCLLSKDDRLLTKIHQKAKL
ncbi:hypothetical protein [Elizabethkingia anophelis]|uniref:hypothetical protein n=1 Tax=Elizabethkingia anophelis TaxID=1117645 RepID=UPI00320AFFBE